MPAKFLLLPKAVGINKYSLVKIDNIMYAVDVVGNQSTTNIILKKGLTVQIPSMDYLTTGLILAENSNKPFIKVTKEDIE